MSAKLDRRIHGPSWKEVILGAVLSLLLGAAIGMVLLVLRPVTTVTAMPKEADRDPKAVYYVQGSRDPSKARQAHAKRQAFVSGQSVTVNEEELNALIAAMTSTPTGKAAETGKANEKSASEETLATATPNVRIQDGTLQIGVPLTVNALGLNQKLIGQARGEFAKDGNVFVFEPSEFYLGSCPLQRVPFLASMVRNKLVATQAVPEDVKAAWLKLANVSIDGNALTLTMP